MSIINLTVKGKQAIGDGTEIVCMNSDYKVRIDFQDCTNLVNLPVKKLVVKRGMTYHESLIQPVVENGQVFQQATLPIIERSSSVELGVVGKREDSITAEPVITTTSATYKCVKSVLCGAVVPKNDPTLGSLAVAKNGVYTAKDHGVDGFYEVDVLIRSKMEESRTVDLNLANGNQDVVPTGTNRTMSQVSILRPFNLAPENIKKDIDIAGVVGTYSPTLISKEITENGEFIAVSDNVEGYYVVNVNVPNSPLPVDISTEQEMTAILEGATQEMIGGIYRYIGETTDTYETGEFYILEVTE